MLGVKRLFFFCLGLFIASAFSMKWMEPDLVFNGEPVTIFGLELFYDAGKIEMLFSGIDEKVRTVLRYHLTFDFVFMAGCYPGIACLCLMAGEKVSVKWIRSILTLLAVLQAAAWLFDIIENYYLLEWLKHPVIGKRFGFYHFAVYSKWIIALSGAFTALFILPVAAVRKRISK